MTSPEPTPAHSPTPSLPSRIESFARRTVPIAVSVALLAYLFSRIDIRIALNFVTLDVTLRFLGPLIIFLIVSLVIETQCIFRVVEANPEDASKLSRLTAARIKAACYLLGLLNYALGAAGVSILLQRRTGASLAAAAGMVFLVSLFDIGSVLVWVGGGAAIMQTEAVGVRLGIVAGLFLAIVAGFVFLRAAVDMGPLDRIRELPILRATRTAPTRLLIEIGILRLLFVGSFVVLVGALCWAFGVEVSAMRLAFNVGIMLVVSALPIAAGGLGTGQLVFVELFSGAASDAKLLAMSVVFSFSIIVTRALIGAAFASEFAREAIAASRDGQEASPHERGFTP